MFRVLRQKYGANAQKTVGNLLPNKSRPVYKKHFQKFEDY
jgi:hypothetical protein